MLIVRDLSAPATDSCRALPTNRKSPEIGGPIALYPPLRRLCAGPFENKRG